MRNSGYIYAKSILSTTAVRQALAINEDMLELDVDFVLGLGILGSITTGLVILDSNCDTIRLVHYTAQQYISKHAMILDIEGVDRNNLPDVFVFYIVQYRLLLIR